MSTGTVNLEITPSAPQLRLPAPPRKVWHLLVVSVLVHVLLLWLLNVHKPDSLAAVTQPDAKPLKARLMFAPPIQVEEPADNAEQEAIQPTMPVESTPIESTVQPEISTDNESVITEPIIEKTQAAPAAATSEQVLNATRQHLQRMYGGQRQQLQRQTFEEFLAPKALPTTPDFSVQSADDKLREALATEIDCSTTAAKGLGLLSGITGGNLRCTKAPPIADYINRRLEQNGSSTAAK